MTIPNKEPINGPTISSMNTLMMHREKYSIIMGNVGLLFTAVLVGGLIGFAIFSPLGMVFFHASHARLPDAEMHAMAHTLWGAVRGAFTARMILWWGSFSVLGMLVGAGVGIVLSSMQARRKLIEGHADQLADANNQISDAYHRLIKTDRIASVGLLASTVVHDMGSYLTVVSSIAEANLNPSMTVSRTRDWQTVHHTTGRIKELCHSVLNFSRGTDPIHTLVDIYSLIQEALALLKNPLQRAKINVIEHFESQELIIEGNSSELLQVIINLIKNAIEAMPKGGTLTLSTRSDPEKIGVSITDTGGGIPIAVFPKLFEAFFTTKGSEKGTGLGLAICKRVIVEHNGNIWAENNTQGGATFHIELPSKYGENQDSKANPFVPSDTDSSSTRTPGITPLLQVHIPKRIRNA